MFTYANADNTLYHHVHLLQDVSNRLSQSSIKALCQKYNMCTKKLVSCAYA